ncbi:putative mitochondrial protein AtMg00310 [Bidens hawaiensis]|uniref:putative mitochondrial protein AtMg00310 n=1 Tax=Bidens hawaiensis TaxID=980011 RepID=UPI004048FE89
MPAGVINKLEALRSRFFWGGVEDSHKIPWVKWKLGIANKENGGLGIGSLKNSNLALLYKWRWRFVNSPNSLWVRVIKSIYRNNIDQHGLVQNIKGNGIWAMIVKSISKLNDENRIPISVIRKKVGNGNNTLFWKDVWIENSPLCSQFPRLFNLEINKDCFLNEKLVDKDWVWNWRRQLRGGAEDAQRIEMLSILSSFSLSNYDDKWTWKLELEDNFSVKGIRSYLDRWEAPSGYSSTRWNKCTPRKVNILVWRLLLDRLPTRYN